MSQSGVKIDKNGTQVSRNGPLDFVLGPSMTFLDSQFVLIQIVLADVLFDKGIIPRRKPREGVINDHKLLLVICQKIL